MVIGLRLWRPMWADPSLDKPRTKQQVRTRTTKVRRLRETTTPPIGSLIDKNGPISYLSSTEALYRSFNAIFCQGKFHDCWSNLSLCSELEQFLDGLTGCDQGALDSDSIEIHKIDWYIGGSRTDSEGIDASVCCHQSLESG